MGNYRIKGQLAKLSDISPLVLLIMISGCSVPVYRPTTPPPHRSEFSSARTGEVLQVLTAEINRQSIPELLVRVDTRDGKFLTAVVGTRDLDRKEKAGLDDCVRVGSVTKLAVAAAKNKDLPILLMVKSSRISERTINMMDLHLVLLITYIASS